MRVIHGSTFRVRGNKIFLYTTQVITTVGPGGIHYSRLVETPVCDIPLDRAVHARLLSGEDVLRLINEAFVGSQPCALRNLVSLFHEQFRS